MTTVRVDIVESTCQLSLQELWALVYTNAAKCVHLLALSAHGQCLQRVKFPSFDYTTIFIHDINHMIIARSSDCPPILGHLFSVMSTEFLERVQVAVCSYAVDRLR